MRFSIVLPVIILIFLQYSHVGAGTIYSWTDKNGIKKFSNTEPEDNVGHVEVIEETPISEAGNIDIKADEEELVDIIESEPEVENRNNGFSTKQKQIKNREDKIIDEPFNEKIQAEKRRLQGEIDRIEKLAVGRSLSLARKNAMIKQFQDKLALLEKSPEEYFEVKDTE